MNDSYREILIQRETPAVNRLLKGALIGLTVVGLVGGILLMPLLLIVGIAFGVASFFVIPRLEVEYEYLYVNGELDIDAIYSRQKRKKVGSYSMEELEVLAPEKSHALDSYLNRSGVKVKDFSSGDGQTKCYVLVFNKEKGQEIIKVELDEAIINDIRRLAPRKVNLM